MAHYIYNFEKEIESYGYLRPYLRVYDKKDIILFNSHSEKYGILSNFHQSSVPMPWMGHTFNSAEAMLFYAYFHDFIKEPKYAEKREKALDFILKSEYGGDVKNNDIVKELHKVVKETAIRDLGSEGWDLTDWEIACRIVKVKYEYCPEFRELVDANKDKFFCEDCNWEEVPRPGVLLVKDKNSPFYGKYVGCNITGLAIQRCISK